METCAKMAPQKHFAGRPTGFRRLSPGLLQADKLAADFAGLPAGVTTPGQLLAAFKAAAPRLGLSVRLVHAIDWLFRFTQPQDWGEGTRPIVWPSAEMQQAGLVLSATQAKEINRRLIEAGLLTMRDSPNGKRYGHRDRAGRIVEAYGFDLAPLVARHAEFVHLAEEDRLERAAVGRLRRRATIARNGITQILETVGQYGFHDDSWATLRLETQAVVRAFRSVDRAGELECGVASLERRQTAARERLEGLLGTVDSDPTQPENRPHNITTNEEINPSKDSVIALRGNSRAGERPEHYPADRKVSAKSETAPVLKLTPKELVQLAPRLKDYLRRPLDPAWRDIVDAADWLAGELGISKPLWGEACILLGRENAAIAVAIVSTKDPDHFKTTAGGYFRGMIGKAKAHELNLDRTIWGLRTANGRAGGAPQAAARPS